jgi:hypothetical protein
MRATGRVRAHQPERGPSFITSNGVSPSRANSSLAAYQTDLPQVLSLEDFKPNITPRCSRPTLR